MSSLGSNEGKEMGLFKTQLNPALSKVLNTEKVLGKNILNRQMHERRHDGSSSCFPAPPHFMVMTPSGGPPKSMLLK